MPRKSAEHTRIDADLAFCREQAAQLRQYPADQPSAEAWDNLANMLERLLALDKEDDALRKELGLRQDTVKGEKL